MFLEINPHALTFYPQNGLLVRSDNTAEALHCTETSEPDDESFALYPLSILYRSSVIQGRKKAQRGIIEN